MGKRTKYQRINTREIKSPIGIIRGVDTIDWDNTPHHKGVDFTGRLWIDKNGLINFIDGTLADTYKVDGNEIRFFYEDTEIVSVLDADASLNLTIAEAQRPNNAIYITTAAMGTGSHNVGGYPTAKQVFVQTDGYIRWLGNRPESKYRIQDLTSGQEVYPVISDGNLHFGSFTYSTTDENGDRINSGSDRNLFATYAGHYNHVFSLYDRFNIEYQMVNPTNYIEVGSDNVGFFKVGDRIRTDPPALPDGAYYQINALTTAGFACDYYDSTGTQDNDSDERPNHEMAAVVDEIHVSNQGIGMGYYWVVSYYPMYDVNNAEIWVPGDYYGSKGGREFVLTASGAGTVKLETTDGDTIDVTLTEAGDVKLFGLLVGAQRVFREGTTSTITLQAGYFG